MLTVHDDSQREIDCCTITFYQITLPPAGFKPPRPKGKESPASVATGEPTHFHNYFLKFFSFMGNISTFSCALVEDFVRMNRISLYLYVKVYSYEQNTTL